MKGVGSTYFLNSTIALKIECCLHSLKSFRFLENLECHTQDVHDALYTLFDTHDERMADTWRAMQSISSPNSWQSAPWSHLQNFKARGLFRCFVRCERDPACESCNFKHAGKICEINYETKETKPNYFISDEQSYYIKRTGGGGYNS